MGYDIAAFKAAFGYTAGVVGQLGEVLARRLESEPENTKLRSLLDAIRIQQELLEKESRLEALKAKTNKDFKDQLELRGLPEQIEELKVNPKLEEAAEQLRLLEELYQAEQAYASATEPLLKQVTAGRVLKARKLLGVPESFSTLSGDEESEKKPSLDDVKRGGGELELDKVYEGSDGKSYQVTMAIGGGGHSAFKIIDQSTQKAFLWKPAASEMMLEAEVGASNLAGMLMPELCPACVKVTIDGKVGTCQPFVEGCDELGDVTKLTDTQQEQMVAHMLTDWLISNHDNHMKQFMVDPAGNLIGIDKGQAFKHFKHGEVESAEVQKARRNLATKLSHHDRHRNLALIEPEHLDPSYWPSSNIGMPASGDFMKSMASQMRQPDVTTGIIAQTIENAKRMTLDDIRSLFGPYARYAFPGQEEEFLQAVLDRAHHLDKELERLQLSAPATADYHLDQVSKMLVEDQFVKGEYPQLAAEIGPLRKAIAALKKVEGIDTAEAPDPRHALKLKLAQLETAYAKLAIIDADCKACERYLSSEYQRVSPLLAAFEHLKVDPAVHADPNYSYTPIQADLLKHWKRIAVERSLADKNLTDTWDERELASAYDVVRSMGRVWEAFPEPEIPNNKVARGDVSEHLLKNYPLLDPDHESNQFEDGEHAVNITMKWPGVMSTTIGKPTEHNFIAEKSFIWAFDVQEPCPGRVIGDINPAEQEVTFPIGVTVHVTKLIVRKTDKTLRAGDFGAKAVVIAEATLG